MHNSWILPLLIAGFAANAAVIEEKDFSTLVDQAYTGKILKFPSYGKFSAEEGQVDLMIEVGFDPAANDRHHTLWSVKLGNSTLSLYFNVNDRGLVFYHFNPENPRNTAKDGYAFLFGTGDLNWKKGERHSIRVQWLPDGVRNIWVDGIPRAQCKGEALFVSVEPEDITNAEQIIGEGSFRLERFRSASHADRAEKKTAKKKAIALDELNFQAAPGIIRTRTGNWQLTTENAIALIDGTSGRWRGWFERNARCDLLRGEGRILIDGTEAAVSNVRLEKDGLVCRCSDGTRIVYRTESGAVIWSVELPKPQTVDGTVTFAFPAWPGRAPKAFVPHYVGETALEKTPTMQAIYGEPGHLAFPLVSLYSTAENLGWSMLAPLDLDRKTFFEFNALTEELFRAVMRVTPWSEGKTSYCWKIFMHEGDYRPGLGKVFSDNRNSFRNTEALMGFSQIGGDTAGIPEIAKYGLRYRVVNTDSLCGGYGLWVPENRDNAYQKRADTIRTQIRELHRHGVKALLYAQGYETRFKDMALKHFSDSILRTPDGQPELTPFGIAMDPHRGGTFHRHILRQIEQLMEEFPDADGFFWDWSGENRQKALIEDVARLVHERGKYLVGNNAYGRTWRFMDNTLAECSTRNLRALQYLALAYPITYLPVYYGDLPVAPGNEITAAGKPQWAEQDFKACLSTGNFLMYQYRFAYHDQSLELLRRYLPLWETIRKRRWVFDANPLQLPDGYEGNIFLLPDGQYAVTMTSMKRSAFDPPSHGTCQVKIKLPNASAFHTVQVLSADTGQLNAGWDSRDGTVTLNALPSAAVIILRK